MKICKLDFCVYNISLPGSTCKIVLTLSKNTLARFSSPFAALTLKTFVASSEFEPAIIPGGGIGIPLFAVVAEEAVPVKISYTSGSRRGPGFSESGVLGNAVICGI